jgi:carotenoid cleavage dioxygenase
MTGPFPETFDFQGFNAPSRVECEIFDLIVEGRVPKEIDGVWYRLIPDHAFPPMLGHDTLISGDGMIGRFDFTGGHVDYKQRYIRTERFRAERAARRGLYGLYRNPFTDDPSVRGTNRGVANTTPIWHGGRLLALKEDSRAVEVHPETLDTIGVFDYGGKLKSETMTAHPRLDPETGELHFFGYEASGLASRDIAYCVADRSGNLIREDWFEAPFCSQIHDFLVTKRHVIFPLFPTTADLERIRSGGAHWIHEQDKNATIGIMPRDGTTREMRWFTGPKGVSSYHFMNAYSEGDVVHMDFGVSSSNVFPFIREASGLPLDPTQIHGEYVRWTFDLSRREDRFERRVLGPAGDMPRIATKDFMRDYEVGYYESFDPSVGPPLIAGPVGAGFNTIMRLNVKTGELRRLPMDRRSTLEEAIHIPSKEAGHEGYLAFLVDLHDVMGSEVWVVEAEHPENGARAKIKLPLRLRPQVHGNWVSREEF